MQEEKIKPVLNGAAETMLQSFYARAMYSKDRVNLLSVGESQKIPAMDLLRSFSHSLLLPHCFVKYLPDVPGSPAFSGCLYS